MNWLDRVALAVSPKWGAERLAFRAAAETFVGERAYDGAKVGRRTDGWVAVGTSANAEIGAALSYTRNRARDLVRNNALAKQGLDVLVSNLVGDGIMGRAATDDAAANARVNEVWDAWCDEADADGRFDFHGLQALIGRTFFESGEVLVRFRRRLDSDGLRVPLQLQVLEGDFLDTSKTGEVAGGNLAIHGVEFDRLGRRVAYWLFDHHPGDLAIGSRLSFVSRRIPASEVLHLFDVLRPGQVRGVTRFAPIILKLLDLGHYDEAELLRKKIEACLVGFVESTAGPATSPIGATATGKRTGAGVTDALGAVVETMRPGAFLYGRPGDVVKFNQPGASVGYGDYWRIQAHVIGAGLGVPYEDLTGDLSQVNYSSYRAGRLRFHRQMGQLQWLTFIPALCRPVRSEVLAAAALVGELPRGVGKTRWTPPSFQSVDPLKDALADRMNMRLGKISWGEMVAAAGYDPATQAEEIAEWSALFDELGLVLEGDARKSLKPDVAALPPPEKKEGEDA